MQSASFRQSAAGDCDRASLKCELAGEFVEVPARFRAWDLGRLTRSRAAFIFPDIQLGSLAANCPVGNRQLHGADRLVSSMAAAPVCPGRRAHIGSGIVTHGVLLADALTSTRRAGC